MKTKPILAVLAGGATAFILGWLIFGMALMGFYENNITHYEGLMKTAPPMWGYVVGSFLQAGLLTYILSLAGINTFGKGFLSALIVTFLISAIYDLYFYNGMNLYSGPVLVVDVIVNTLMGGLIGGVVALVLGSGKKE
jgi:hypothetical protein